MFVSYTKGFQRAYRKLPTSLRNKFKERRNLFLTEPFHPLLYNHPLTGAYAGCRSINITGDYRAILFAPDEHTIVFTKIGTHHDLFGT